MLTRRLRAALQDVVATVGIPNRIVPHQFRHTYGTEMLRAGVSFAAVIKLLGHKSPHMTLEYIEITQQDLQREFHLALSHPRHLVPAHTTSAGAPPRPDLSSLIASLMAAQHVLEMYRRNVDDKSAQRLLERLANRILKILNETRKLNPPEK
jgi:hypothetical protein